MNRDMSLLLLYSSFILVASMLHDTYWLSLLIVMGAGASYPHTRWVLKRTLMFPMLFTVVTLGSYALLFYWQNGSLPSNLPVIVLRIVAMSIWSFALVKRVDLIRALAHFKGLQFLLVVTRSQIELFAQSAEEARLAYKSRSIITPSWSTTWKFYAGLYASLLEKALHRSKEVSMAMRSRGLFDA